MDPATATRPNPFPKEGLRKNRTLPNDEQDTGAISSNQEPTGLSLYRILSYKSYLENNTDQVRCQPDGFDLRVGGGTVDRPVKSQDSVRLISGALSDVVDARRHVAGELLRAGIKNPLTQNTRPAGRLGNR